MLIHGTCIGHIAVIGETVRCGWLSFGAPLFRVEDTTNFGGSIDNDNIQVAFDLTHLFTAHNLAEDSVLGDDSFNASTTSELFCKLTDSSGLQKVGEVLVQQSDVAHFSIFLRTSNNHGVFALYVQAHREQVGILGKKLFHVCLMKSLFQQAIRIVIFDEAIHRIPIIRPVP